MNNFEFYNPTRIIFGKGTETRVGAEVKKYGSNILFVHYGNGVIEKLGLYGRIVDSLKKAGVSFTELKGVKPNPVLSLVHEGIRICREKKIDFVLGVGGGSVIDTAKSIAVGVPYEGFLCREERSAKGTPHRRRAHHPRRGQRGEPGQRHHQRRHHVQDPLER
jgi:hypothetical protein